MLPNITTGTARTKNTISHHQRSISEQGRQITNLTFTSNVKIASSCQTRKLEPVNPKTICSDYCDNKRVNKELYEGRRCYSNSTYTDMLAQFPRIHRGNHLPADIKEQIVKNKGIFINYKPSLHPVKLIYLCSAICKN